MSSANNNSPSPNTPSKANTQQNVPPAGNNNSNGDSTQNSPQNPANIGFKQNNNHHKNNPNNFGDKKNNNKMKGANKYRPKTNKLQQKNSQATTTVTTSSRFSPNTHQYSISEMLKIRDAKKYDPKPSDLDPLFCYCDKGNLYDIKLDQLARNKQKLQEKKLKEGFIFNEFLFNFVNFFLLINQKIVFSTQVNQMIKKMTRKSLRKNEFQEKETFLQIQIQIQMLIQMQIQIRIQMFVYTYLNINIDS